MTIKKEGEGMNCQRCGEKPLAPLVSVTVVDSDSRKSKKANTRVFLICLGCAFGLCAWFDAAKNGEGL